VPEKHSERFGRKKMKGTQLRGYFLIAYDTKEKAKRTSRQERKGDKYSIATYMKKK